jgi:uncharacterized protein
MLPDTASVKVLHEKYAPDTKAFDLVYTHCSIVKDIALELLKLNPKTGVDIELVVAGCLLHDIGTYSLYINGKFDQEQYLTHGLRGSAILKDEGLDVRLQRIASHHTGVGISKEEIIAKNLPLPHEDFLAETIEERLVMYADKFHSKGPQFNSYATYKKRVGSFGTGKAAQFEALSLEFGIPDLEVLAVKYGHPIR